MVNLAKIPTGRKLARGFAKLSNGVFFWVLLKWKILLLFTFTTESNIYIYIYK